METKLSSDFLLSSPVKLEPLLFSLLAFSSGIVYTVRDCDSIFELLADLLSDLAGQGGSGASCRKGPRSLLDVLLLLDDFDEVGSLVYLPDVTRAKASRLKNLEAVEAATPLLEIGLDVRRELAEFCSWMAWVTDTACFFGRGTWRSDR